MRSSVATAVELGDLQRWAAVALLLATLALKVVDVAREWPRQRPPITADECDDLCARSGLGVQVWTYDGCTCQGAEPPKPEGKP